MVNTPESKRRAALAAFLKTRRARLKPSDVGLPPGARRRTPGLRREEVALLADVGTTWYTWLEQGRAINVSEPALERIADALRLTDDERCHLFVLARVHAPPSPENSTDGRRAILQRLLDDFERSPAFITGRRCEIVMWNSAATVVFGDFGLLPARERTMLWRVFTDPDFRSLFVDWESFAQDAIALFRVSAARYVGDPWYERYVSDLMRISAEFGQWWQRHDVLATDVKQRELHHSRVGRLLFDVVTFHAGDDPDMRLCVYMPIRETPTEERLHHLLGTVSGAHMNIDAEYTNRARSGG